MGAIMACLLAAATIRALTVHVPSQHVRGVALSYILGPPQPTSHRSISKLDWLCLSELRKGKGAKELAVQDVVEASEDSQVQESESESMDERDVE